MQGVLYIYNEINSTFFTEKKIDKTDGSDKPKTIFRLRSKLREPLEKKKFFFFHNYYYVQYIDKFHLRKIENVLLKDFSSSFVTIPQ